MIVSAVGYNWDSQSPEILHLLTAFGCITEVAFVFSGTGVILPKMAPSAVFSCPNLINTPIEKGVKSLVRIFYVVALITSYKAFKLSKGFFNYI